MFCLTTGCLFWVNIAIRKMLFSEKGYKTGVDNENFHQIWKTIDQLTSKTICMKLFKMLKIGILVCLLLSCVCCQHFTKSNGKTIMFKVSSSPLTWTDSVKVNFKLCI